MIRYASFDVGSNTVRLLIAEKSDGGFRPVRIERIITRLGGNFSAAQELDRASMDRTLGALRTFAALIKQEKAETIFAVGTGVLRTAANGGEFIRRVREETGISLRVISGEEEGRLMLKGVFWSLRDLGPKRLVMDIGGWSTEVIWAEKGEPQEVLSLPLGVVSLTENFLHADPPAAEDRRAMEKNIKEILIQAREDFEKKNLSVSSLEKDLIGTAGSVTTLAAIDLRLANYHHARINGHRMSRAAVRRIYDQLVSITAEERLKIPGLEKGREDLVIPGTAIVSAALDVFAPENILVIDSGLLEGVLLDGVGM